MPHKAWVLHASVCVLLILMFVLAQLQGWLKITTVQCQLDSGACPPNVQQKLEALKTHSYFFTNLSQVATTLLPNNSYAVRTTSRIKPREVLISLTSNGSLYQLMWADGQSVVITPTGTVLPENTGFTQLPQVMVDLPESDIISNQQLNQPLHQTLLVALQQLSKNSLPWSGIEVRSPQKIVVTLSNLPRVIIDTTTGTEAWQRLPHILASEQVTQLSPPIQEIDLRFNLPVLRTSPSEK